MKRILLYLGIFGCLIGSVAARDLGLRQQRLSWFARECLPQC
jgi:hypothetical protein